MKLEGGCYCGKIRYVAEGEPMLQAQCYCPECQYITRGAPNTFIVMPLAGHKYTKGTPKGFRAQRPRAAGDAASSARIAAHTSPPSCRGGRSRW